MSSSDQVQTNGHEPQENGNSILKSSISSAEPLPVVGQLNEQRRIFLKSTIQESSEESREQLLANDNADEVPQLRRHTPPPNTLTLSVKYATLPSPTVAQSSALRSPLSPPPKPPMLSRTRSTGSGDGRTPLTNGDAALQRQSVNEQSVAAAAGATTAAPAATTAAATATSAAPATTMGNLDEPQSPPATISARHYESLIEELRCPGCAGPLKAPVLLCKSGHSVCEQCTRILLMCPLCKVCNTQHRSHSTPPTFADVSVS